MDKKRIAFIDNGLTKQQIAYKLYGAESGQCQGIEPVVFFKRKVCHIKSSNDSEE